MKGIERNTLTIFLIQFLLCCIAQPANSQAPEIEWQKSYGSSGWDEGWSIQQTADGGYIVAGQRGNYDGDTEGCVGEGGYWIVKLFADGSIEWYQCYGGSEGDKPYKILVTSDGGYIIAGRTYSIDGDVTGNHGNADAWIVKINATGNLQWQKCYGGSEFDEARSIIQTTDGGYLIGCRSASNDGDVTGHHGISYNEDFWVAKIDEAGDIIWQKSLGGNDEDYAYDLQQVDDGTYYIIGETQSTNGDVTINHGSGDYWVIHLDTNGEIIWQKTYGGSDTERPYATDMDASGNLFVAGYTYSNDGDVIGYHGNQDYWIIRIDSLGNLAWQKCLGGENWDVTFDIKVHQNHILLSGISYSDGLDVSGHHGSTSFGDCWIVKTDSLGNIIWEQSYGGTNEDQANSICVASDTSYVFVGFSRSSDGDVTINNGNFDFWVVKLLEPCEKSHYYTDADGDSFGDLLADSLSCYTPFGYVTDSTDCDDTNNLIYPWAEDICNAIDDNCNGEIDEDAAFNTWYLDADDDDFGDIFNDSVSCFEVTGYVIDNTDCNDTDALINPLVEEICNAIDDNCNIEIDEGLLVYTHFEDLDGDTFGNADILIISCLETIAGYVLDSTDCDDANSAIHPGAAEVCNGLDDDCDDIADDNIGYQLWYIDADGDDYGNVDVDSLWCENIAGYVPDSTDCDDTNPDIYPGAPEILNDIDDDCDLLIDEDLAINEVLLQSIKIYPNPTEDILYLEYTGSEELHIEIVNITGQVIFEDDITTSSQEINVNAFASGMYVLRIFTEEGEAAMMFVKE